MNAHQPHLPSKAEFQGLVLRVCQEARFSGEDGREQFGRSVVLAAAKEAGQFSDAQLRMRSTAKGHEKSSAVEHEISWAFTTIGPEREGFLKKPFGSKKGDGKWELSKKGRAGRPLR